MATKTSMTVDEFLRLPDPDDCHYELVDGELVSIPPPMYLHNHVRDSLLVSLWNFVKLPKLGMVISGQLFHLFENTVRYPDLAFVRKGRTLPPDKLPDGAPDLAIEVVSHTDTPHELHRRMSDFFAAGCTRVWVVYPEEREVYIHGMSGSVRRKGDEKLEDPELLPGFSVPVSTLFEQPWTGSGADEKEQ